EHPRPRQRRERARGQIAAQRHAQGARDRRHERAHRADEAGDDDALGAVPPEQRLAAFHQLRIAPEQHVLAQLRPPAVPDPEAQCIAEQGAQRGAGQRIRPVDVAEADQRADREQQRQRRHHDADHCQRIAEGDQEHQSAGGDRVRTDPGNGVVEPGARHRAIMPAGLQCRKRRTPMPDLSGKTLFITGASRGIGRAIALRAARDGANVAIAAKSDVPNPKLPGTIHTVAAEVEAAGGRALALKCDIRDADAVRAAVAATAAAFGGIDVLVNNASASWLRGTLDTPMKRFDLMQQVNARGTFLCAQACLPHLLEAQNPHILTLAPPPSLDPKWWAPHTGYTLAKMGMSFVTLGLAAEFAEHGVAINALWPRTLIATDALNMIPGVSPANGRSPDIMADAAHAVLTRPAAGFTGRFLIDDEVLA